MHQTANHLRHAGNTCWSDYMSNVVYSWHLDAHILSHSQMLWIVGGLEVMATRTASLLCVYTGTGLWAD